MALYYDSRPRRRRTAGCGRAVGRRPIVPRRRARRRARRHAATLGGIARFPAGGAATLLLAAEAVHAVSEPALELLERVRAIHAVARELLVHERHQVQPSLRAAAAAAAAAASGQPQSPISCLFIIIVDLQSACVPGGASGAPCDPTICRSGRRRGRSAAAAAAPPAWTAGSSCVLRCPRLGPACPRFESGSVQRDLSLFVERMDFSVRAVRLWQGRQQRVLA